MQTLGIIKVDAVSKGFTGKIIDRLLAEGFTIRAMRQTRLTRAEAEEFYGIHRGKDFFEGLIDFTVSGAIVALALEKDNAIADWRKLIGATDPQKAAEGTLRRLYGTGGSANAVHGSDSEENAKNEIAFFFTGRELLR
jgi:nucleoside-diphosphate kinase